MNLKVYVVCAAGANAGTLTLRGAELLRQASVVIHDALVGEEVLKLCAPTAERILSGDPFKNRDKEQSRALELMLSKAANKEVIVRLRGGDPYYFGSGGTEAAQLAAAGIDFELVPGVSQHLGAPGYVSVDVPTGPFLGQRIVVTRGSSQALSLAEPLRKKGAEVLEIPVIKTVLPSEPKLITDALLELNSYDWVVFTSANGVTSFFELFFRAFDDMRDIGGVRIAAVGPGTAAQLQALHLKVDVMPKDHLATEIVSALTHYESIENLKILLLRAEVSTPELPKKLEELGAIVDDIPVYKTVPETADPTGAAADLMKRGADWVTFTSASTVENFHARFPLPELMKAHPKLRAASIGPETSKALSALGIEPAAQAREHTVEGLVKAMEKAARQPA